MEPTVLSVAQFLDAANQALRQLDAASLAVEGEVSDARVAQGKWVSFDLKDGKEAAVLKCFATVWQLPGPLENGMKVRVSGLPKIYERFGTFRLNVQHLELVGEGALRHAYELLKKKLTEEGLFDPGRKRAIARFPERIGLITSRDAAAYGDFLRVLGNRWGGVEILFVPVHVQGKEAVPDMLAAFAAFQAMGEAERPEALVLVRGGGGLEDLHAFNDESVARAVFQSKVPVVVGVGHERDESLCDFVADVRASTPSNAAERLSPSREEIAFALQAATERLSSRLEGEVARRQREIDHAARAFGLSLERAKERLRVRCLLCHTYRPGRTLPTNRQEREDGLCIRHGLRR